MSNDTIFMDKIKLATYMLGKEDNLIQLFGEIIAIAREQKLSDLKELSEQNEWSEYWKQLQDLYDFTKNDYLAKLNKEKKEKIQKIFDKYCDTNEDMTLEEVRESKDIMLEIMSYTGFHDVLRIDEDDDFADI